MNKKGQAILAEHVMILFAVIASLVAMSAYVQRGLQARIHDARNYMIEAVNSSSVCDANCMSATGGQISLEYEPYYQQMLSDAQSKASNFKTETNGSSEAIGVIYNEITNEENQRITASGQLPAVCAAGSGNCQLMPN